MPHADPAIRRAGPADVSAVAAVLTAAFAEFAPAYTPAALAATTPRPDEIHRRLDEGPVWVAVSQAVIVGTVAAVPRGEALYMRSMAVLPAARGRRIGQSLLQELEEYARGAGYRRLFLSTTPFLADAIWLYEQWGFQRSGDGPHELFGTPLFTMVKVLAAAEDADAAGDSSAPGPGS